MGKDVSSSRAAQIVDLPLASTLLTTLLEVCIVTSQYSYSSKSIREHFICICRMT